MKDTVVLVTGANGGLGTHVTQGCRGNRNWDLKENSAE